MVECVGLENRYARKGIEGSNPSLSASKVNDFKRIAASGAPSVSGTERTGTNPSGAVPMHAGCMQKTSEGIPNALFRAWPNVPEHIRLAILALIEPYRG